MKKLHAGHYIAIFFVFFISFLVTALIASRKQDHYLVAENYYDLDLQYQQRMVAKNNIARNPEKIRLVQNGEKIVQIFINDVQSNINGIIKLYRPSDKTKDQSFALELDSENKITIPTEHLDSGRWILIVDWSESNEPYYKEFNIFL